MLRRVPAIIINYFMNLIVSIYFWKVEVDLQTYWLVERVGKYNGMKRLQIFE